MKKSKLEAAETRRRIVRTAAAEFRRNGINETGLSDLMAAAGLTHGGFYRHFGSKDQLVAEACSAAMESVVETTKAAAAHRPAKSRLQAIAERYLSTDHRDNQSEGCGSSLREVMTALAPQRPPGFSSSWMSSRDSTAGRNSTSQKDAPWSCYWQ
jgi:AcrR family transcriptional regulator